MKIILNEKTYFAPKVKARMLRDALILTQDNDLSDLNADTLDEFIEFVCNVFQAQFSVDDVYDHLDSDELIPLVQKTLSYVAGKAVNDEAKKKMIENQ